MRTSKSCKLRIVSIGGRRERVSILSSWVGESSAGGAGAAALDDELVALGTATGPKHWDGSR